ncbi:MAG: sugar phosphate isomerase/epimerase family protein, partial [Thermomicrobiales bacterium]
MACRDETTGGPPWPNPLFLNTVLLGGTVAEKIAAAGDAGFDQIELWREDVEQFEGGADRLKEQITQQALGLTDLQVLSDFDGAPADKRDAKRRDAEAMLDTAAKVGADTVLAPASTDQNCDSGRIAGDMRWFTRIASTRGLRIAYEGMAWS